MPDPIHRRCSVTQLVNKILLAGKRSKRPEDRLRRAVGDGAQDGTDPLAS